jgi:uncharacterized protein YegP (UPF0339 family)
MLKFHIYEDAAGAWRWRLKARNGRIVADGAQGYSSQWHAERAAASLIGAPLVLVVGKDPAKVITKGGSK